MNWEIVGAISALIASIATLLTLVYLSIQVRDSNKLARASSLKAVIDGYTEHSLNSFIENRESLEIYNRGMESYDELTKSERLCYDCMITREVLHLQNVMQQHEHGLVSDTDYQSWLAYVAPQIKSPGGSKCWGLLKPGFPKPVVEVLEEFLELNPSTPSWIENNPHRYNE